VWCLAREKMTLRRFSPPRWLMGPKFMSMRSAGVVAVADAHEDDVTRVALDVFQIFTMRPQNWSFSSRNLFSFQPGFKSWSSPASRAEGVLNVSLLCLRKTRRCRCSSRSPLLRRPRTSWAM